jgi:Protein of unknown function (DUF3455)
MFNRFASIIRLSAALVLGSVTAVPGFAQESLSFGAFKPSDTQRVATTTASGVQIYSCEFDASHHLGWVFKRPHATLYDSGGRPFIEHDAGPSWVAADGSRIIGHVVSQASSRTPDSIPQLLLETKSVAGRGTLSAVRYVQRLDTVGGAAPGDACTSAHQVGNSPYLARYVFWK